MKLTEAQRRELERVRDEGRSRTKAGHSNRLAGRTEFLWKLRDGRLIGDSQVSESWYDEMQGSVCVGERLLDAGSRALSAESQSDANKGGV